jgi:sugar phosphate isomerase/epimerase
MELKLACSDYTFPLLPHDKVLDLVSMLGFDSVDIGLFEDRSHLWPSKMFESLDKNARELSSKLKDRGLKLADLFLQTALDFTSVAANHPDHTVRLKSRNLFQKTLDFTAICEGKHVSGLPGVYFAEESREASFMRCCEELAWRSQTAAQYGIVFSVEAHLGSIVPTPQEALKLVRGTPGLTLTLDYTHFAKQGIPDVQVEPLIRFASHFHARGAARDRLQTPVNESSIDYYRVVQAMKAQNYSGYIGIEYTWNEWENCNRTDNLSETILMRNQIIDAYQKA